MTPRWMIIAAPVTATLALSAGLVFAGWNGWTGAPASCAERNTCFCEEWRPGPIRQPANTVSNIAFVIAGLLCAGHAYRNRRADGGRMHSDAFYPALFATSLCLIGPASAALHASMTYWGGKVDGASMYLFISFCVAFGLSRRFRWSKGAFFAAYALMTLALVATMPFQNSLRGETLFGCMIAVFVINELIPEKESALADRTWLKASAAFFFSAFAIWLLSVTPTSPLCDPQSLFQGHAVWHVLTAASGASAYPYFLQEAPFAVRARVPAGAVAETAPG